MATIIQTLSGDQMAQMTNSTWARPVALPANWTKLRIGARLRCTDFGSGPVGTPRFAMGLCSGTTNILGDASTTHFVGAMTNSASWSYSGASNGVYFSIALPVYKKVNVTDTFGSNMTTDMRYQMYVSGGNQSMCLYFIEITKGSPNYTINCFGVIASVFNGTITNTNFLNQLQAPSGGCTFTGHQYGSAQTIAVDEVANGTLNCVNFWWNLAAINLMLHDVGIATIS